MICLQKDTIPTDFVLSLMNELPESFPHKAPDGYRYEALRFKSNVLSIWIVHRRGFVYNDHHECHCIWGFYNSKTREYFAPINSSKQGDKVDVNNTTPYSAMQLNLNPLMAAFS